MNITRGSRKLQRGQALVLIILAITAIFGFSALAVDIGQIFMVRRSTQAAADSAAMAAAFEAVGASLDKTAAIAKAYEMAKTNGFNNDQKTNWVVVNNPPVGGAYCGVCGSPQANEYYQVKITVRMKPIFAQFVYDTTQQTTVEAIAHAKGLSSVSSGDAIVSLSSISDSLEFDGNTGVNLDGGNIRSFGGMIKNGNSGGIVVTNGKVYYGTSFSGHTEPFSPAPKKDTAGDLSSFQGPFCPTQTNVKDGSWTAVPNAKKPIYYKKLINGSYNYYYPNGLAVENLPKGIHCVDGGIDKGNYIGKDVLVILMSGGIKQTGNDSIDFRAPLDIVDANGNHFGGLVLYAPKTNISELQFGGNADAYWQGSVFAPGAFCKIGGTSDNLAYHSSFICNTIKIHGNPTLKVNYKASENYRLPPYVELVQ